MRIWQILFLASIAALPVQLGKFFFLKEASYVLGLPAGYLSVPVYFSDLIVVAAITAHLWANKNRLGEPFLNYKPYVISAAAFVLYLITLTSLTFPTSPTAVYFTAKIAVLVLYSLTAADFFQSTQSSKAGAIIKFSVLWQSAIIIAQFAFQRSLNVWILGERLFTASTVNIAHFDLFGQQFLRPYGTFPHPNVAAAFLLVYIIILVSISKKKRLVGNNLILPIAITALFITFSKTAVAAGAVYFFLTGKNRAFKMALLALLVLMAAAFISTQKLIPIATVAERMLLSQSAYDLSLVNPLFGAGPTSFIRSLSTLNLYSLSQTRLLQPVHNIFLLTLAEEGIFGLLIFALLLFSVFRRAQTPHKQALFLVLLIFGSFDHFLLTLHQGQLLLFLAFGYILSKSNSK